MTKCMILGLFAAVALAGCSDSDKERIDEQKDAAKKELNAMSE